MVMTKEELLAGLENEVRILLHLAGKIDPASVDYRPSSEQRSLMELLQYLTMMGPFLLTSAVTGVFDRAAWEIAEHEAQSMTLDETKEVIAQLPATYAASLATMSDADLRDPISLFGPPMSRGPWLVMWVLGGHAAYRTQLVLYLKACGRKELNTMNLWGGFDEA